MSGRLFTYKHVFRWEEALGVWSLNSGTPDIPFHPTTLVARREMEDHATPKRVPQCRCPKICI